MEGGRNDRAIIGTLKEMAQALHCQQNKVDGEFCGLLKFHRNNLPTFNDIYDPEGAQAYLREIKKTFRVMACTKEQKGLFGTHMLISVISYTTFNFVLRDFYYLLLLFYSFFSVFPMFSLFILLF